MKRVLATLFCAFLAQSALTTARADGAGKASWYDCATPGQCSKSKRTASGEKFNPNGLTAAHRRIPLGTRIRVTHKGRSVVVRINDRGPFVHGRVLDLSRGAARSIGLAGVGHVTWEVL